MAETSENLPQVKEIVDARSEPQPQNGDIDQASVKRKADGQDTMEDARDARDSKRRKGTAPVKEEFLIKEDKSIPVEGVKAAADDDAAEAFHHQDRQSGGPNNKSKRRQKQTGQNKAREYGSSRDQVNLCSSRANQPEFSPNECQYGDKCRFEHDIRKYLSRYKREDLATFNALCPVWETKGRCPAGWKCRFLGSHSQEVEHEDGRKELVLTEDAGRKAQYAQTTVEEGEIGVANVLSPEQRFQLIKRKIVLAKSDEFLQHLEEQKQNPGDQGQKKPRARDGQKRNSSSPEPEANGQKKEDAKDQDDDAKAESRATYSETRLRPSEKRRIYFGAETPVLAPLTTQGNLPFRRLCTSLGAMFTYSEMAMSMPILQGQKSEWALMKAHESDLQAPTFTAKGNIVYDYDQSKDVGFGAQIAANKPWVALKATEVLTTLLPQGLRVVDLNVGCPIDLVYREGAGSALMDSPPKLEKMLRGMNYVSGEVPVTVKIRMGTKDKQPTAQKLVERLVLGSQHSGEGPCGVAAITLHGRSRQQRYSRSADWEYIGETAALIKRLNEKADAVSDTIRETDERDQGNGSAGSKNGKVYFVGNGDVFSHEHYYDHLSHGGVDGVMAARGALIKPWLFEEIQAGQYLDKSSSERLSMIEQFCRYGLEAWGSDEVGVGQTRRFLLEWLSFACRYVPVGLLEHLPPNIQDRPPRFRGRDELETLMASDNYKDWIKIR